MPSRDHPTPGEILRDWQRGACEVLQNIHHSVQQLHANVLRESINAIHHMQEHHGHRVGRGHRHAPFASLTTALPVRQPSKRSRDCMRFNGNGMNCVIGGLADSFSNSDPQPTQAASGSSQNDTDENQERLLISEIEVRGVEGPLKEAAESALTLKPNFSYTMQDVKDDTARIMTLGWFASAQPDAEDTRDGLKLIFQLEANNQLKGVEAQGANLLPAHVIEDAFQKQCDKTLNLNDFGAGINKLNSWYSDRGIYGQVTGIEVEDDVAQLKVSEYKVGRLNLQFQDRKTGEVKDEGKTKPDIILRQLTTKPGQVYSIWQTQRDVHALDRLDIFIEPKFLFRPSEDSTWENPTIDLTLQLKEKKRTGLQASFGISGQGHAEGAVPGFVGSVWYRQNNLFGLNQKLQARLEAGQSDMTFRLSHTDPWVRGDPHRTSRDISLLSNRTSGSLIHAKAQDDGSGPQTQTTGPDGNVNVARLIGAVEYGRPLAPQWKGTLGINFQRASCLDDHNQTMTKDCYDAPLTFSGGQYDTMMVALLRCVYAGHSDSKALVSMEQALPLHQSWLNFNRLRLRAERSFPLSSNERVRGYVCGKGGVIIGDLPPYEAFPIGGRSSVRGYGDGAVGSGRNFVAGTAELHFPLIDPVEGTLLFDYGSDLNSGASVLGDPAGMRGKPGTGWGYGAGIRSGPFRLEYAWNREGRSRVHLGIEAL